MSALYSNLRVLLPDNSFLAGLTAVVSLIALSGILNVLHQLVSRWGQHSLPLELLPGRYPPC